MKMIVAALLIFLMGGVGSIAQPLPSGAQKATQRFPDVIAVKIRGTKETQIFDFDVTISSPYDTPARYADAFRLQGEDGKIYGERILWHDHADEQPFTRDLYGVKLPAHVKFIVVQARDKVHGYGGTTQKSPIPGR